MSEKNITLHPLNSDGSIKTDENLYPKTKAEQVIGLSTTYATKAYADETFLTIEDAEDDYLTKLDASATYLASSIAASTYLTKTNPIVNDSLTLKSNNITCGTIGTDSINSVVSISSSGGINFYAFASGNPNATQIITEKGGLYVSVEGEDENENDYSLDISIDKDLSVEGEGKFKADCGEIELGNSSSTLNSFKGVWTFNQMPVLPSLKLKGSNDTTGTVVIGGDGVFNVAPDNDSYFGYSTGNGWLIEGDLKPHYNGIFELGASNKNFNSIYVNNIREGSSYARTSDVIAAANGEKSQDGVNYFLGSVKQPLPLQFVQLTQAQYDALATKDDNTLYIITDTTGLVTSMHLTYQKAANVNFLAFEVPFGGSTASIAFSIDEAYSTYSAPSLSYSYDRVIWTPYTLGTSLSLADGQKIYWKGTNSTGFNREDMEGRVKFTSTKPVKASGSIMTLLDPTGELTSIPSSYCFYKLFSGCSNLKTAPELPATTLQAHCYDGMFESTGISDMPLLPALNMVDSCYYGMFTGCSSLKVSSTQEGNYTKPYIIPSSGTGVPYSGFNALMLYNTGGTFRQNPDMNTTYYIWQN